MSEAFVPGNFNVGVNQTNPKEAAAGPIESDLGYYGWRVVIAACLGVMTGFGSLFVYTFSVFVKPLARRIRVESRSRFQRLRHRRRQKKSRPDSGRLSVGCDLPRFHKKP